MNNTQFKGHLVLLAEMTNKDLSTPLLQYWWQSFGDLPDETLLPAFEMAKQSCRFFPSPAEFREFLQEVASSQGAIVNGYTAWEALEKAIFRPWSEANDRVMVQENRKYPWPTPLCREVLRGQMALTPRDVAMMHPKEYAATRERFIKAFDSAQTVGHAVERTQAALDAPTVLRLTGTEG